MKIRQCLVRTGDRLFATGVADSRLEAEVLLRHCLDMDRGEFFASLNDDLPLDRERQSARLVQRRLKGEPLAYITGHREFYGLDFVVNPDVLIPRQESELLVDAVLEYFPSGKLPERPRIADVGTGSGAIAIAIASNLLQATVYATDVSHEALAVADMNRRDHGVSDRVHLCPGDLLEALPETVDAIVSNPPYLRTGEIPRLPAEIMHEPRRALDGGPDGLEIISHLIQQAGEYLRPNGCIMLEIAPKQLEPVLQLASNALPGATVTFARDLIGLPRLLNIALS